MSYGRNNRFYETRRARERILERDSEPRLSLGASPLNALQREALEGKVTNGHDNTNTSRVNLPVLHERSIPSFYEAYGFTEIRINHRTGEEEFTHRRNLPDIRKHNYSRIKGLAEYAATQYDQSA